MTTISLYPCGATVTCGECPPPAVCESPYQPLFYGFTVEYYRTDSGCSHISGSSDYITPATVVPFVLNESIRACLGWTPGTAYEMLFDIDWSDGDYSLVGQLRIWQNLGSSVMSYSFSPSRSIWSPYSAALCELAPYSGDIVIETSYQSTGGSGRVARIIIPVQYGSAYLQSGECVEGVCTDPELGDIDVSGKQSALQYYVELQTEAA